mmetsp:Transcript_148901/g.263001  ORF Transcript_148901/g.263001 Transcript_148901/m.263001 type:complete len:431 (-) Transcript_148901:16-1308(-)
MLRIVITLVVFQMMRALEEHVSPARSMEASQITRQDPPLPQRPYLRLKAAAKKGVHAESLAEKSSASRAEPTLLALSQRLQALSASMQRGRSRSGCGDVFGDLESRGNQVTIVDLDASAGCHTTGTHVWVHFVGGSTDCVPPTPPAGCHRYVVVNYTSCAFFENENNELVGKQDGAGSAGKFDPKTGVLKSCEAAKSEFYLYGEDDACKFRSQADACPCVDGAEPAAATKPVALPEYCSKEREEAAARVIQNAERRRSARSELEQRKLAKAKGGAAAEAQATTAAAEAAGGAAADSSSSSSNSSSLLVIAEPADTAKAGAPAEAAAPGSAAGSADGAAAGSAAGAESAAAGSAAGAAAGSEAGSAAGSPEPEEANGVGALKVPEPMNGQEEAPPPPPAEDVQDGACHVFTNQRLVSLMLLLRMATLSCYV